MAAAFPPRFRRVIAAALGTQAPRTDAAAPSPVWILHGGDHFTVLWQPAALRPAPPGAVDLCAWNGLPPNRALAWVRVRPAGAAPARPVLTREGAEARVREVFAAEVAAGRTPNEAAAIAISRAQAEAAQEEGAACTRLGLGADGGLYLPPPAPPTHAQSHWRPSVGEVESVVQASAADKRSNPGCWRSHSYELALYTPEVVAEDLSEPRPPHVPSPPVLEMGAPPPPGDQWRW